MVGDGCRYCNPQEYIDRLHDTMAEMDKEKSDEKVYAQPVAHRPLQSTRMIKNE